MGEMPQWVATIQRKSVEITNGTGTAMLDAWTAGASGMRVERITAVSSAPVACVLQVWRKVSGSYHLIGAVALPPSQTPLDVLKIWYGDDPDRAELFAADDTLAFSVEATIASGTVTVQASGGDY